MNYFFGFSYWKHDFIKPFLTHLQKNDIIFINPFFKKNYFDLAIKKGLDENSSIYIWGRKSFPKIEEYAKQNKLKLFRIEDGFIRSVGLGSDLTQPYSLVVDTRGIYFDPTIPSDLEHILNTTSFNKTLLDRAKKLQKYIIKTKLSKYNLYENKKINTPENKKIILVPGQVEDDASIKYGTSNMDNLKLLQLTRECNSDAYIIYKPHPDVLVGNRIGNIENQTALQYADAVVTEVGIDSVLDVCSEVHTMTSLVGFEALLRGKRVFTYGMPFYAGWGLTQDRDTLPSRARKLSLDELVAGTMLIYPKYINPITHISCEVEELLDTLEKEKKMYINSSFYRIKIKIRNIISRKSQLLFRIITLKI
jgi:capsular polysaccharide export protein